MSIEVTVATEADADELAAALVALVPQLSSSSPAPGADEVRALVLHEANTQFVARDGASTIVGVATLAVFPIPTGKRAWIEDVIVDEASAGQGIGAALVEAMLAQARHLGCKTVDLTSRPSREAANHLYRKLGFQQRDTNVYRLNLDTGSPAG